MKERFLAFALRFAKRRTKSQKNQFIKALWGITQDLGYSIQAQLFRQGEDEGRNFVVGDLSAADVVYLAGYDTGVLMLEKGRFSLTDDDANRALLKRNLVNYKIAGVILLLVAAGMLVLSFWFSGWGRWASVAVSIALAALSLVTFGGVASKWTFKKSSCLFLLFELMAEFRKRKRCFVFTDHSAFTAAGRRAFLQEYDLKGKKVVYIANAATPGETVCLYAENCSSRSLQAVRGGAFTVAQAFPFPDAKEKGIEFFLLAQCLQGDDGQFYLENFCTGADIQFDENAYERIKASVFSLEKKWQGVK